ncbi:hypothetical protein DFH08DRAFT_960519 [Mycena albidolilacea]|uniref:Uncharacterized protein n=1 Tax=Mycena albidolilacea TaxID=1033008 RepID=A0AAD7EQN7_9AGAR|nr:hypothetical protein DFH08DRAFT_960519 [Mycena albidolilacea]
MTVGKICNLPFTHLESASLCLTPSFPPTELQRLLSSGTLRRLKLAIYIHHFDTFMQIWDRCSPLIRHLKLDCRRCIGQPLPPFPSSVVPIPLHSLRAVFWGASASLRREQQICPWALYPFDLTHLKALSLLDEIPIQWETIPTKTVRFLELHATNYATAVDLGSFPQLAVIRIALDEHLAPMVLTTLSTIEPLHRIHTILLDFSYHGLDETDCAQLDSTLSTLPLNPLPTVMFTDGYDRYEIARGCFPRLMERNMLQFVAREEDAGDIWWENVVKQLDNEEGQ